MSVFKYTLPSGKKFIVNGPAGATQEQADKIFYGQVAAGGLVGYEPGEKLTSVEVALAQFALSRQDRGIAGVSDTTILALTSNLPVIAPIPSLINVPIVNPITQSSVADIKKDGLGPIEIGDLSSTEVEATMAQVVEIVDQPFDEISEEKGVGKFGFSALELERTGYLKPNTYNIYIKPDPSKFVQVLSTPSVWTGKDGIYLVDDILADESAQTQIQADVMLDAYDTLVQTGFIVPPQQNTNAALIGYPYQPTDSYSTAQTLIDIRIAQLTAALIINTAKFGIDAVAEWLDNLDFSSFSMGDWSFEDFSFGDWSFSLEDISVQPLLDVFGKASEYAVDFANYQLGSLVSGVKQAEGYVATVDRSTVDAAFTRVVGNPKVPIPVYGDPTQAAKNALDIKQAQKIAADAANNAQNSNKNRAQQYAEQAKLAAMLLANRSRNINPGGRII